MQWPRPLQTRELQAMKPTPQFLADVAAMVEGRMTYAQAI